MCVCVVLNPHIVDNPAERIKRDDERLKAVLEEYKARHNYEYMHNVVQRYERAEEGGDDIGIGNESEREEEERVLLGDGVVGSSGEEEEEEEVDRDDDDELESGKQNQPKMGKTAAVVEDTAAKREEMHPAMKRLPVAEVKRSSLATAPNGISSNGDVAATTASTDAAAAAAPCPPTPVEVANEGQVAAGSPDSVERLRSATIVEVDGSISLKKLGHGINSLESFELYQRKQELTIKTLELELQQCRKHIKDLKRKPLPQSDLYGDSIIRRNILSADYTRSILGFLERMLDKIMGQSPQNCIAMICDRCNSHNGLLMLEDALYDDRNFRCWNCTFLNAIPRREARAEAEEPTCSPNGVVEKDSSPIDDGSRSDDEDTLTGASEESRPVSSGEENSSTAGELTRTDESAAANLIQSDTSVEQQSCLRNRRKSNKKHRRKK